MGTGILSEQKYSLLIQEAAKLGASACTIIPSCEILVKDKLAALCNGEYICHNYGLSISCPPHVEGPGQFRTWQLKSQLSLVVKIELPSSVMFSKENHGVMRLLHEIVTGVEKKQLQWVLETQKALQRGHAKICSAGSGQTAGFSQKRNHVSIKIRSDRPCLVLVLISLN